MAEHARSVRPRTVRRTLFSRCGSSGRRARARAVYRAEARKRIFLIQSSRLACGHTPSCTTAAAVDRSSTIDACVMSRSTITFPPACLSILLMIPCPSDRPHLPCLLCVTGIGCCRHAFRQVQAGKLVAGRFARGVVGARSIATHTHTRTAGGGMRR